MHTRGSELAREGYIPDAENPATAPPSSRASSLPQSTANSCKKRPGSDPPCSRRGQSCFLQSRRHVRPARSDSCPGAWPDTWRRRRGRRGFPGLSLPGPD
ncbi:hypothetical protein BKM09_013275 [Pseudomonas amygdali pv. morsprunorum]|nr:hypothetical protein CXB39_27520 [Pseudomonas amygdali pv. morsprunorum]POY79691.1 hypothetical protein BKM09_013275 [Pseudomonas amygdali pv. morsprunorum]